LPPHPSDHSPGHTARCERILGKQTRRPAWGCGAFGAAGRWRGASRCYSVLIWAGV